MTIQSADQIKMKAQLDHWDKQLGKWNTKAVNATGADRIAYENELESLLSKRDRAHSLLLSMKFPSEYAWEGMRDAIEHSWHEIDNSFKAASVLFTR